MAQSQNEIKFLHFRFPQDDFAFEVFGDTSVDPRGGVTVAYVDNGDGTFTTGQAACSVRDNYVKATGRFLAASRLVPGHEFHGVSAPMTEREFVLIAERSMASQGLFRKFSRKNRKTR